MADAIDIAIVSFNTRALLLDCLGSIFTAPPARLGTVYVVDNGSADDSVAAVRDAWPEVTIIEMGRNAGFAAANNAAITRMTAPLALLLNSDTVVPAGAIDTLAERLDATGATAAGPRLVDGSGRPELSFGAMLSPVNELRQAHLQRLARDDSPEARRTIETLTGTERVVDWVTGACLLVRRDAALEAGLLDERFFMYEEDVDFCAALRSKGGSVLFTPAADVTHLRGRSWPKPGAGRDHYDRSHLAFYRKHLPFWAPLLAAWQRVRGRNLR